MVVILHGAGDGVRTRECELGKLVPYHLATPAWLRIIRYWWQGVRSAFDFWLPLNQKFNNFSSLSIKRSSPLIWKVVNPVKLFVDYG